MACAAAASTAYAARAAARLARVAVRPCVCLLCDRHSCASVDSIKEHDVAVVATLRPSHLYVDFDALLNTRRLAPQWPPLNRPELLSVISQFVGEKEMPPCRSSRATRTSTTSKPSSQGAASAMWA